MALYHGAWSGLATCSLLGRRRLFWPEGEGLLEFIDGFGCAEEEKTLRVTVHQARDVRVADMQSGGVLDSHRTWVCELGVVLNRQREAQQVSLSLSLSLSRLLSSLSPVLFGSNF